MASAPSITITLPGYPFQNLNSVATIALLRAINPLSLSDGANYAVEAGTTEGDGGGGVFSWVAGSLTADNGTSVIKPTALTSLQAGRWIKIDSSTTAFATSIASSAGAGLVGFSPTTTYPANTVGAWLHGQQAASRTIMAALPNPVAGNTVYLTEAGRQGRFIIVAGSAPTDTLQGLYVPSTTGGFYYAREWDNIRAQPEWFGGKVNDAAVDNAPIIQAMVTMKLNVELSPGSYYIGTGAAGVGTSLINLPNAGFSMIGAGASQFAATPGCTEFVIRSAAASGILVGLPSNPGGSGVSLWPDALVLRDFLVRRDVANFPLQNPVSGFANAPCGIKAMWSQVCIIENVYTLENSIGLYMTATVANRYINMRHLRYTSGINSGNDFFAGFFQDNSTATPFNSGNASVYYIGGGAFSNEAAGNSYTYAAGIQSYQGFTDTYVTGFETSNCGYGVDFNGRQTAAADYHTEDLIISQCVFDGCRWDPIRIQTTGPLTAVQAVDNYCAVSNATGPVSNGINITESHGSVSLIGNQVIGIAGNPANGLMIFGSSGVSAKGNIYTDISNPVVISSATACRVEDHINVSTVAPAVAGVQITASANIKIDCDIVSSVSASIKIPLGVSLIGTANSSIEINGTNIYTPGLTGASAANKIKLNGVDIHLPGYYTGAGASSTSTAGTVLVTGIAL